MYFSFAIIEATTPYRYYTCVALALYLKVIIFNLQMTLYIEEGHCNRSLLHVLWHNSFALSRVLLLFQFRLFLPNPADVNLLNQNFISYFAFSVHHLLYVAWFIICYPHLQHYDVLNASSCSR